MLRSTCLLALCLAALCACAGCGRERGAPTQGAPQEERLQDPPKPAKADEAKSGGPAKDEDARPGAKDAVSPGAGTASPGMGAGAGGSTGAPPGQPPGMAPPQGGLPLGDPQEKAKGDQEGQPKDGAAYREDFGVEAKDDAKPAQEAGGEAVADDKATPPAFKRKAKTGEAGYREDFGVEARDKQPPQVAEPPKNPKPAPPKKP